MSHLTRAQAEIDATFGNNGRVFTTFSAAPTSDAAAAVTLQPDGKLVVAGQGNAGLEMARYTTTGALDATFGTGGKVIVPLAGSPSPTCMPRAYNPPGFGTAYSVCLQADGKVVVAGAVKGDSFVARFLANGTLDAGFGTNGVTYICGGTVSGYAVRVGQQPTGELIVMGHAVGINVGDYPLPAGNAFVYRLQANGSRDSGYSSGLGAYGRLTDGLVDNAGRALGVGFEDGFFTNPSTVTRRLVVLKVLANGTADPTFGTAGIAALNQFNNQPVMGRAIAQMPNGQILVLGETDVLNPSLFLARFNANGTLDASFGTNGTTDLGPAAFNAFPEMSLQADGKIVLVGTLNGDFVLRRLLPSGQPDTGYGLNGYVTINEDVDDQLKDVLIQPDGSAVAVGYAAGPAGQNSRFAVLRVLPTGRALASAVGFSGAAALRAVPNPSSGAQLQVEMNWPAAVHQPVSVELLSPMGQVVTQTTLSPVGAGERRQAKLAPDQVLAAGLYVLRARCATGVLTSKVLVQ
ncbi:hypothetical protein IC235_17895 [Hymenobacter sp. BT664]|uniref:T9SS type A sorting domain-containing protein n=1 Tax=Hymenobacter montanus TaxID=2771359 RepID=A0A927GL34_9BACT|nr:hypothetical protein [Hymenobacter montanus]MBD2769766.1 hypothetical protein [Hymenobacter montanus]